MALDGGIPKTDWIAGDIPTDVAFNRIEGNIESLQDTKLEQDSNGNIEVAGTTTLNGATVSNGTFAPIGGIKTTALGEDFDVYLTIFNIGVWDINSVTDINIDISTFLATVPKTNILGMKALIYADPGSSTSQQVFDVMTDFWNSGNSGELNIDNTDQLHIGVGALLGPDFNDTSINRGRIMLWHL